MADTDRCASCGAEIPEGRQVCATCMARSGPFDTYANCLGCPYRRPARGDIPSCHSRCRGYIYRAARAAARRAEKALELSGRPKPSEAEIRKRLKNAKERSRRGG